MASEHERRDDFDRAVNRRKPGQLAFPSASQPGQAVNLSDDEKRALTMFGGGSWHAGSSEVLPDSGDIGNELSGPRRRPGVWIRLRLWLGIDRRHR